MFTPVFSSVFMAIGYQKCLSSDRTAIIRLVCARDALKWLNWFREIKVTHASEKKMQCTLLAGKVYSNVRNSVFYSEYIH